MESLECQNQEFGPFFHHRGEPLIFLDQEWSDKGTGSKIDWEEEDTDIRESSLESVARVSV